MNPKFEKMLAESEQFLKDFLSRPRRKYTAEQLEAAKKHYAEYKANHKPTEEEIAFSEYVRQKYSHFHS